MTAALVLDIVVVLTLLGYAVRGWRTGVLGGGLGLLGLVAGAALALWGAPRLIAHVTILNSSAPLRAVVLIVAVLVAALVGQGLLGALGRRLRSATPLPWLRIVDSLFGSCFAGWRIIISRILRLSSGFSSRKSSRPTIA